MRPIRSTPRRVSATSWRISSVAGRARSGSAQLVGEVEDVGVDEGQRIVDLVGHPGGQGAHRGQAAGDQELGLHRPSLADVPVHGDGGDVPPFGVAKRDDRHLAEGLRAVLPERHHLAAPAAVAPERGEHRRLEVVLRELQHVGPGPAQHLAL
jgi:hypothetical protein